MLWIREKLSDHHEIDMNHIQDIDLHPQKRKKNLKENVLPERARAKFQQIEIAHAHSPGYSS